MTTSTSGDNIEAHDARKSKKPGIKLIFFTASILWSIMVALLFLTPLPFTACSPDSLWCSIAYAITTSGGPIAFFGALIITSLCYGASASTLKFKALKFLKSIIMLVAVFGILAFINERYTKPILKSQRPSHIFMLDRTGLSRTIDSLYQLDKKTRQEYFAKLVGENPIEFKEIDKHVLAHWVEEAGFSFPSGHTFNAFLFSMILAYAILFNRSFPSLKKLYLLPFIWAFFVGISRVALGAHSALDVMAGGGVGILFGGIFLYVDNTRIWLTGK